MIRIKTGELNAATDAMKAYTTGLKGIAAANSSAKYTFADMGSAVNDVALNYNRVYVAQAKISAGGEGKPKIPVENGTGSNGFNPFWFMKPGKKEEPESDYGADYAAKKAQFNNLIELAREHSGKKIALKELEYAAFVGFDDLHKASIGSLAAVKGRAYSAMEKQMLRLVETKKFSVKAFGAAVAQQVKLELVGLASKAAVWSLFEVAMGFKDLATPGMQGLAALHFKSAAQFATVSGGALLGAAAIQSVAFGGAKKESAAGTGGGTAANSLASAVPVSRKTDTEPQKQVQHVTVVINNPLSEQNWDQITEENIIPAINAARDRNIELDIVRV